MNDEIARWIPQDDPAEAWFSVRHVLRHQLGTYEEVVTIWRARSFAEAERRASAEAMETAKALDAELLSFAQVYKLREYPLDGSEVFSLMRDSDLDPAEYVNHFFDTGDERQGGLDSE